MKRLIFYFGVIGLSVNIICLALAKYHITRLQSALLQSISKQSEFKALAKDAIAQSEMDFEGLQLEHRLRLSAEEFARTNVFRADDISKAIGSTVGMMQERDHRKDRGLDDALSTRELIDLAFEIFREIDAEDAVTNRVTGMSITHTPNP